MKQKLKVWHIPQVPMKAFEVEVESVEEGVKVMDVLADYDKFQYENNVKPDYCNANGLYLFDPEDDTDSPEGSWVDWYLEIETENDFEIFECPYEYLEFKKRNPSV